MKKRKLARNLAETGVTAHQIASITGHAILKKEVRRYIKAIELTRLNKNKTR